jgi:hypothetical protein
MSAAAGEHDDALVDSSACLSALRHPVEREVVLAPEVWALRADAGQGPEVTS